jgi:hypothetical protein
MRIPKNMRTQFVRTLAVLAAASVTSCGSSKTALVVPDPTAPVGLPTPAAPGPVNTYSGAQSPGSWILTLNNTSDAFSYQPVTYPATATGGGIQVSAGFSSLGSAGLVFEVPGQAAVLRPGNSASAPVFAVPQTQCYAITGRLRFQYIPMFPGPEDSGSPDAAHGAPFLGYGSVVASTDSTGKSWQFQNLQGGTWTSNEGTSGTFVSGPDSFTGSCNSAGGQAFISLAGDSQLDDLWTPDGAAITATTQSNAWIGPSGFFVADQNDTTQAVPTGASVAGVAESTSPLSTSSVLQGQYLGILYEAANTANYGNSAPVTPAFTAPVGFGQVVAGTSTTMTGGVFPNDAVTGTPNSDIQIKLGAQDATLNGLYTSVSITVPDPAQNCANFVLFSLSGIVTSGLDAHGYPTCTFPGVAIAGNPEGKYAIFVNSYDWAVRYGGAPMQLYLFQQ